MTTRSERMTLLAASEFSDLDRHWKSLEVYPSLRWAKPPQLGAIAVQARASRTGTVFEIGEMTATRCTVEMDGVTGYAFVAGRNKRHAAIAAVFDAMAESEGPFRPRVDAILIDLQAKRDRLLSTEAARAIATAVDLQE